MIIGLTGKAGAGKDTLAQALTYQGDFIVLKFADKLKDMLCVLLDCTRDELEDRQFKEAPHPMLNGNTPRYAMQTLGTEWGREMISPELWVDSLRSKIEFMQKRNPDRRINIVITDVLFPQEAQMIRELGGKVFEIHRDKNLLDESASSHSSENGIPDELINAVFNNHLDYEKGGKNSFLEFIHSKALLAEIDKKLYKDFFKKASTKEVFDLFNLITPESDSSKGPDLFRIHSLRMLRGLIMALVDLRDQGLLELSFDVIFNYMKPEKYVELASNKMINELARNEIKEYLTSAFWYESKGITKAFISSHGFSTSYLRLIKPSIIEGIKDILDQDKKD